MTQNLLSLRNQCLYANSVALGVFIDQIKNWILEAYHQQLGKDMTFIIWWLSFYLENIGKIACNFSDPLSPVNSFASGFQLKSVLCRKKTLSRV